MRKPDDEAFKVLARYLYAAFAAWQEGIKPKAAYKKYFNEDLTIHEGWIETARALWEAKTREIKDSIFALDPPATKRIQ